METDVPPQDTGGGGIIWKFPKIKNAIRSWCQKRKSRREDASGERHTADESGVNDSLNATRDSAIESAVNMISLEESPDHQAEMSALSEGHGDGQAVEADGVVEDMEIHADEQPIHSTSINVPLPQKTLYDTCMYLVSSSKQTPHVQKIKDMCQRNGWRFTTPFNRKLGEPKMQSAAEAIQTCSCVVLVITKEDCNVMNGKYNMTIEMAFEYSDNRDIRGSIIPIRCCDENILPLWLRSLTGSSIHDNDLERSMIETINGRIREQRQVTGASDVIDASDVTST